MPGANIIIIIIFLGNSYMHTIKQGHNKPCFPLPTPPKHNPNTVPSPTSCPVLSYTLIIYM